jgi:uncharacterized lipoprotein YmbA
MPWLNGLPRAAGAVVVALLLAACASPATMTPQQKEAYELRRYCEQNPNDVSRCLGYLGDH